MKTHIIPPWSPGSFVVSTPLSTTIAFFITRHSFFITRHSFFISRRSFSISRRSFLAKEVAKEAAKVYPDFSLSGEVRASDS